MKRWAAVGLVLLTACATPPRSAAPEPSAPAVAGRPPRLEIPNRELWEDDSFGSFRVTSYNTHHVSARRIEVLGGGRYVGDEPAQPECYLSYGGPAAFIEPRYLMNDLTKGSGFSIIGVATFSKPPPPIESQDVVCRPSGETRS
ncbi:MAG TPA: hypothetical protein VEU29_04495 [Actinomycetota bacterium]|nr:hypothetical protein [Actinomycetota bacterium]